MCIALIIQTCTICIVVHSIHETGEHLLHAYVRNSMQWCSIRILTRKVATAQRKLT